MEPIFKYDNYREYLRHYFDERKRLQRSFSSRFFAQKAGFSSHCYCSMVIDGKRNLSDESIEKIAKAIGFKPKENEYFRTLVYYNQSDSVDKKEHFYNSLSSMKKSAKCFSLSKKHLRYFDNWYYPVIRHLAVYSPWKGDFSVLASMVKPKITKQQAKEAVESLEAMNLINKDKNGDYTLTSQMISSGEIPAFAKMKARRQMLEKGIEAAENIDASERFTTYTTMSVSKKTYSEIIKVLENAKQDIINKGFNDKKPEKIYELILQMFPISEEFKANNEKEQPL